MLGPLSDIGVDGIQQYEHQSRKYHNNISDPLLNNQAIRTAIKNAWSMSFWHPAFDIFTTALPENQPLGGGTTCSNGMDLSGKMYRETFFWVDAKHKPGKIYVSPCPLSVPREVAEIVRPPDARAFFHTHPTQTRAHASKSGASDDFAADSM